MNMMLAKIALSGLDKGILFGFFAVAIGIGIYTSKSAGKSDEEFFLGGRSMPWWLLGFSMVATTFSTDTPNLVTGLIRDQGVSANWCWWAFLLTGMLTVFVYAKLWRRSKVMTDLGFYEIRYSGQSSRFLQGFRAIYLGVFVNIFIMATVSLAAIKIGGIMLGLQPWECVVYASAVTVLFSSMGGFKGVLITDFLLFIIAMLGAGAAAYYALSHPDVKGLSGLLEFFRSPADMAAQSGIDISELAKSLNLDPSSAAFKEVLAQKLNMTVDALNIQETRSAKLNMFPELGSEEMVTLLLIPIAVQWWSSYYPGAEPGGGGYLVQRMLSAKNEKHAMGATLFFNIAHYALRPWPWILVALASLMVFPDVASIQAAFPDAKNVGEDSAYSAMLTFLPSGWLGLVFTSLVAAYMSTISTHLNWGSSYVVNDVWQKFVKPDASQKELVWVGRISTVVLMVVAGAVALGLKNAQEAFNLLLLMGAGTGLVLILRWFWWRINAMCEIVAMVVSFITALALTKGGAGVITFLTISGTTMLVLTFVLGVAGMVTSYYIQDAKDENPKLASLGKSLWKTAAIVAVVTFYFYGLAGATSLDGAYKIVTGVFITTVASLLTAFVTPATDQNVLKRFIELVNPGGPGWGKVIKTAEENGESINYEHEVDNIPLGILCMVLGCFIVYGFLLGSGYFIYGKTVPALICTGIGAAASVGLFSLWSKKAA